MDSDDDTFDNVDSGNVSSGEDDFPMEVDMSCSKERQSEPEDYPFEVLTTEEIVQHMVDCIKEVNTVVEVSHGNFLSEILAQVQVIWSDFQCLCDRRNTHK